jgi:hydroxymethylpyrimidine/phosphomethylpyrimidine kinase
MERTALTIAGSDSSGGAGIQADLKTWTAMHVFGMSALTAITAQATTGVRGVVPLEPSFVVQQIETVADDLPIHAVKLGMLAGVGLIEAVGDVLSRRIDAPIVMDPVMVSKAGSPLIDDDAVTALAGLIERAAVITPNRHEAARLLGTALPETVDEAEALARSIHDRFGCGAVMLKGLREGDQMIDVVVGEGGAEVLQGPWIEHANTHGSGCTLSAAIAGRLARGDDLSAALSAAKRFVSRAMAVPTGLGKGPSPVNINACIPGP